MVYNGSPIDELDDLDDMDGCAPQSIPFPYREDFSQMASSGSNQSLEDQIDDLRDRIFALKADLSENQAKIERLVSDFDTYRLNCNQSFANFYNMCEF